MEDFRVDLGIFLNPENLQTVQSQIDSLSSRNVTLKINTQDVLKDVNLIKQQLKSIGVDFGGANGVSTAVKKEMAEVEKTVGKTFDIISKETKTKFANLLNSKANGSQLLDFKGIEKDIETTFGKIGTVTTKVVRDAENNIDQFTISVKSKLEGTIGEVEELHYRWKEIIKDNKKTGDFAYSFTSSRATDNNIKLQEEATRKATQANKEHEAQMQKSQATAIKLRASLNGLKKEYEDSNNARPISSKSQEALKPHYDEILGKIKELETAEKNEYDVAKAQIESKIKSLKLLIEAYRKAENSGTQLRTKPVEVSKIDEEFKLDAYIAKMQRAGIVAQEFWYKINGVNADGTANQNSLKSKLEAITDTDSLNAYLNLLSNVQAEGKKLIEQKRVNDQQAAQSQENINKVFQRTLELEKQIGQTRVKIAGLDPEKDKAQIAELNNQLNTLVNESQLVKGEFSSAFSTEQILKLNDVIKETENRIAEIKAQLQTAQSQKVAEIKTNFSNGQYEKEVNAVKTSFDGLRNTTTELKTAMDGLDTAYANLKTAQAGSDPQKLVVAEEAYVNALKKVKNQLDINTRTEREQISAEKMAQGKQALYSQIDVWLKNNSAAAKKFGAELREIQAQLKGTDAVDLKALRAQFQETTRQAKILGLTGKSLKDQFSQTFKTLGMYFSSTALIMRGVQYVRQMYDNVLKVDTAMTGLYRVTNLTGEQYAKLYDDMTESAKKYGSQLSDIIDLTTSWVKLGFDSDTAERLAEISTMYQHVADIDTATANENLVSTYKGFQKSLDETFNGDAAKSIEYIADIFDKLNNEYAVTAADVGAALQRSASSLQFANNTLQESSALVVGMNEVLQNAEKTGTILNTTSLRLMGAKGKLEELGEEVDENIESVTKLQTHILNLTHGQVNIFNDDQTFKSTYEILKEISKVYDSLSDVEAADLLESIAGKRNANGIAAVLKNFDQVEKSLVSATNAAGTASKENQKYMERLEGRINATKASWQALANSFLSSDFLKGLISSAQTFLDITNDIVKTTGALPPILAVIAGYLSASKNIGRDKMFSLNSNNMPIVVIVLFGYEQFRCYQC